MTSVHQALRAHFRSEEYALLFEVRNEAGFRATNSADAIAMNMWSSRGLEVHGVEIKSHRSDWLHELKRPAKAEAIFKYCDRFWLVAATENVVKKEEVPVSWGFMQLKNNRLYTIVKAPQLKPKAMTRSFIAALIKRATTDVVHTDSIQDEIEAVRKLTRETYEKRLSEHDAQARRELDALQRSVKDFENASGIHISSFMETHTIGAAVRVMLNGGADALIRDMRIVESACKKALDIAEFARKELEARKESSTKSHPITSRSKAS